MDFFDRKMNLVDFATEWLRELCESSNVNVYFGVVLINSSAQGSLAPAAFWPDVADPNKAIMQTVEKCVAARSLQACRYQRSVGKTSQDRCAVALPLLIDEQIQAVLALEIELALDGSLEGFQRTAERHLVLLEAIIRREIGSNAERLTAVLNLVATALHYESFQAASTAVATELAGILECERVSIGFVDKGHAVVKALSHSAVFTEKANLVRDLSASMDEAIDQRAITVFPAIDSNSVLVTHHLSELVRSAGDEVGSWSLLRGASPACIPQLWKRSLIMRAAWYLLQYPEYLPAQNCRHRKNAKKSETLPRFRVPEEALNGGDVWHPGDGLC